MKKKVLTGLLSLAIAFGLWLYVITAVSPGYQTTIYNVPVVFSGESYLDERGLMIVSGRESTVTLHLEGNRSDLNKLDRTNTDAVVDLTKVNGPGEQKLQYVPSYPGDVSSNAISVMSRSPEEVILMIERKETKTIDVVINYIGSVPENYTWEETQAILDYPRISISGPDSVVSQIETARIDVDLTDRTESINESYRFTLCDKDGEPVDVEMVTTNVAEVHLEMKIQMFKDIKLKVEVIDGGGATSQTADVKVEPEMIRVAGSEAALKGLDELVIGQVKLAEWMQDDTKTMSISDWLPEGVENLTGIEDAEVSVSFAKLKTKRFNVRDIRTMNVPEDLEVNLISQALWITVRGPSAMVDAIKTEDIWVEVEFGERDVASKSWPAQVVFSKNVVGVGALGTYSINAELQEPVPEDTTEATS